MRAGPTWRAVATPSAGRVRRRAGGPPWLGVLALAAAGAVVAPAADLPPRFLVTALALAPDGAVVAAGEHGTFMRSLDGGRAWTRSESPIRTLVTGLWIGRGGYGLATAHDALLLETQDDGRTWTVEQRGSDAGGGPLLGVAAGPAGTPGLVVGSYGQYLRAGAAGLWRHERVVEEDLHLNALAGPGGGRWVVVGEAGLVARSDDDGLTWDRVDPGYEGSFHGLVAVTADTWVVCGLQGTIRRTEDAGATWREVASGTTALLMVGLRRADGRLVLGGAAGTLCESRDDGRSFAARRVPGLGGIADLLELPDGTLLAAGEHGVAVVEEAEREAGAPAAEGGAR